MDFHREWPRCVNVSPALLFYVTSQRLYLTKLSCSKLWKVLKEHVFEDRRVFGKSGIFCLSSSPSVQRCVNREPAFHIASIDYIWGK
ncbi:hypothetical protein L208DRAFT_608927 [Tricholoma matsutake]|nr:hypothetical protein L208DRAFT_608927 [Tricholoma matsutake 945]